MILQLLYFFIPAYISNMMPVFVKKINFLDKPVDFGKKFHDKRILGTNKTWRGFFFGIICATIAFEIQRFLFNHGIATNLAYVNYASLPIFLGALLGFSALFGDIIESFFKRQLNIPPGRPWVPFDQLDFLIIAIIFTLPWSGAEIGDILILLAIIFFSTIIVQYSAYKLKLKKDIL